ncbi:hypothetical protein [Cytobacillus purgationiresistens]|uniref:Uncharacterized protein n=1 Tax=Cytobacillus purgationiresistens TaxID=863449 RepID=A0ABU0ARU6_9BACI|nr:hypothetical protein [Cytobacillus purgationiresistens]MDQ0273991.1 hypothetical protein [Cytobacillus purgationiresistens]
MAKCWQEMMGHVKGMAIAFQTMKGIATQTSKDYRVMKRIGANQILVQYK